MTKLFDNKMIIQQKRCLLSVFCLLMIVTLSVAQTQPTVIPGLLQRIEDIQGQNAEKKTATITVDLNGMWDFTPEGLTQTTLPVPGFYVWKVWPTGTNWFDFGDSEDGPWKIFEGYPEGLYETQFNIPASMSGGRIYLHFESINFFAEIFVNSQYIGSHIGGYVPIEFDITDQVSAPSTGNTLEVDIIYNDGRFLNGIEQPIWPVGFFGNFWNLGITGGVSVIGRSAVYIDDIYVKTSYRNDRITSDITIRNDDAISHNVTLNAGVEDNGTPVLFLGNQQILINPGDTTTVTFEQTWSNPQMWEPGNPHLYHLVSTLTENFSEIHEKSERFGFREIWMQGNQFYINGIRTNLRGDNIVIDSERSYFQYYVPEPTSWSAIVDSLFALNFNVIRFHQEPALPWLIDICDEKGMLVIAESAAYNRQNTPLGSAAYVSNSMTWQKEWIKRDRNHPSIIIWSAENEMWIWGGKYSAAETAQFGVPIPPLDATRPILFEGDFDLEGRADTYSYHYIYGFPNGWPSGSIYQMGSYVKTYKPTSYGEFEWTRHLIPESVRVRRQCIKTRAARYLGFADIRPYRLDWAWHPSPEFFTIYEDWMPNQDEVDFLANTMNPVAAFDKTYYEYNVQPPLPEYNEYEEITRAFILFNDERAGTSVEVQWNVLLDDTVQSSGSFTESIDLGEHIERDLVFRAPLVPENKMFELEVSTWKSGVEKFRERTPFLSREIGIAPPNPISNVSLQRQGNDLTLSWDPITTNIDGKPTTIDHYVLYRCSNVTFAPGQTDSVTTIINPSYIDDMTGILDNPDVNRYYRLKVVDNIGFVSELSDIVGVFDFELLTQSGTDFNAIALPLALNGIIDSQQLLSNIPGCNSVAFWDVANQGYEQYIPGIFSKNFSVDMGNPYLINATLDTFFTLIGEITNPVFSLQTTPTSDFNNIMIPLTKTGITTAATLLGDIPTCNSVARWNPVTQAYDQYVSGSPNNFNVYVGHAYLVNVTGNVTWPAGSSPQTPTQALRRTIASGYSKAPHLVWGSISAEAIDTPLNEIGFIAYREQHPNEILTEKSPGCWFREKYWAVQCASFPSKWKAGDTCIILFQDNKGNKLGEARVVLTYDPADKITIQNFESPRAIPKDVGLSTNFPNPFNARTIIPYHLDRRIPIRLSVINIRGEEIRILYNGFKEAGHHQIHWDGLDGKGTAMPSGMYMLRLQWNNNFDIQKLMLIR